MNSGWLRGAMLLLVLAVLPAEAGTVVRGLRLWRAPDYTRLVFDLSSQTAHTITVADDPARVIIDLTDARLAASLAGIDLGDTPIRRIRSGMRDPRTLRIVLDVAGKVDPQGFQLRPSGEYGQRLVVDLHGWNSSTVPQAAEEDPDQDDAKADGVPPSPQAIAAASAVAATPPAPAPSAADSAPPAEARKPAEPSAAPAFDAALAKPLPRRGRKILIAVDAGHGGEDPGAIGPRRTQEKDVVLAIARQLAQRINAQPGFRATMIRSGDYYVGLAQRRELARKRGADLFVSVHADAFNNAQARGGSVYALSPRGATSTSAAFLAQRENGADLIGGVDLGAKDDVLAGVLTDLSMTATMDASLYAGKRVLNAMGRITDLHREHVEQAGFMVLKSPDMPSILVETGFISNPAEVERLRTPDYQQRMARAIFDGLNIYFSNRPPPETQLALAQAALVEPPGEYVIAHGDTLSGIAERYRVSVSDIVRTNRLGGGNDIRAGQKIVIPGL